MLFSALHVAAGWFGLMIEIFWACFQFDLFTIHFGIFCSVPVLCSWTEFMVNCNSNMVLKPLFLREGGRGKI